MNTLKSQCKDFLAQHGSPFLPIISDSIEPKIACQGIGICQYKQSTTAAPVSPVTKYSRCILGMNYWCASRENAELCNVSLIDSMIDYGVLFFRQWIIVNDMFGQCLLKLYIYLNFACFKHECIVFFSSSVVSINSL
jgi:hypothetical protein